MSLYDPFADTTPSQRLQVAARRARLARIEGTAKPDTPIACLSASERTGPPAVKEALPEPEFSFHGWVERQDRKNPLPKPAWFSIEDEVDPPPAVQPRIIDIQRITTKFYGISMTALLSERKTAVLCRPRQVAMYLSKTLTERSLPEIGRRFGGRDHTTVLHGVRKIERLMTNDPDLVEKIDTIKEMIVRAA